MNTVITGDNITNDTVDVGVYCQKYKEYLAISSEISNLDSQLSDSDKIEIAQRFFHDTDTTLYVSYVENYIITPNFQIPEVLNIIQLAVVRGYVDLAKDLIDLLLSKTTCIMEKLEIIERATKHFVTPTVYNILSSYIYNDITCTRLHLKCPFVDGVSQRVSNIVDIVENLSELAVGREDIEKIYEIIDKITYERDDSINMTLYTNLLKCCFVTLCKEKRDLLRSTLSSLNPRRAGRIICEYFPTTQQPPTTLPPSIPQPVIPATISTAQSATSPSQ